MDKKKNFATVVYPTVLESTAAVHLGISPHHVKPEPKKKTTRIICVTKDVFERLTGEDGFGSPMKTEKGSLFA